MCAPDTELTQQSLVAKETKGDLIFGRRSREETRWLKTKAIYLDESAGLSVKKIERDTQFDLPTEKFRLSAKKIERDTPFDLPKEESHACSAIKIERDTPFDLPTKESHACSAIKIERDTPYMSIPNLPIKRPCEDHSSTSPFLSARKHCKTEASQAAKDNDISKVATGIKLTTPFTYLTVAVGVVCGIDIWNNENEDDMVQNKLLESQDLPQIVCKPVYTEDSFIVARSKPKLLVGWYLHAF